MDWKKRFKEEREMRHRVAPSSRFYFLAEDDFCPECNGSGYRTYGDTSTWRGGAGGQAFTDGVCDKCWGSGSKSLPWPSHREFDRLKRASQESQ